MAGPVPTEALQYTEDQDRKLHEEVADNSTKAGHPVTAVDVNPAKDSNIQNIKDILGKTAGHAVNLGGEGPLIHVETASGPEGILLMEEKREKQKAA